MRTHYFKKDDPETEIFDDVVKCYNQDRLIYGANALPLPNERYFRNEYNDTEELEFQVRFTACGQVSYISVSETIHDLPQMELYLNEVYPEDHDIDVDHKQPLYPPTE